MRAPLQHEQTLFLPVVPGTFPAETEALQAWITEAWSLKGFGILPRSCKASSKVFARTAETGEIEILVPDSHAKEELEASCCVPAAGVAEPAREAAEAPGYAGLVGPSMLATALAVGLLDTGDWV